MSQPCLFECLYWGIGYVSLVSAQVLFGPLVSLELRYSAWVCLFKFLVDTDQISTKISSIKARCALGKCSNLFSKKMLVFRAGIHKMDVKIANREDPDQTASEAV